VAAALSRQPLHAMQLSTSGPVPWTRYWAANYEINVNGVTLTLRATESFDMEIGRYIEARKYGVPTSEHPSDCCNLGASVCMYSLCA
jgi:hypothetical protein